MHNMQHLAFNKKLLDICRNVIHKERKTINKNICINDKNYIFNKFLKQFLKIHSECLSS